MHNIHLPLELSTLRIKTQQNKKFIFDRFRKKYVSLSKEEMVRQVLLNYLVDEKGYPKTLISVEKELKGGKGRYDAVVYSRNKEPLLVIECKKPDVKLNEKVLEQISAYNRFLKVPYWLVTNGPDTWFLSLDKSNSETLFLKEIPEFKEIDKG